MIFSDYKPSNFDEVLRARRETDFWKAQARLYMIELAKVNRACSRKSWHIKVMREQIKWAERDKALFIDRLNHPWKDEAIKRLVELVAKYTYWIQKPNDNSFSTAKECLEHQNHYIKPYQNDPVFHAKIDLLVSHIFHILDDSFNQQGEKKEGEK